MRSAKFTAPREKEVEKTKEGQLDADAFNKKRMAKFEDAPTAYTERPALQRGTIPMTRSRAVTEVSGPGRSRGAAMDGTAVRVMIEKQFNPLRNGPVFRKCQTFFTITFIVMVVSSMMCMPFVDDENCQIKCDARQLSRSRWDGTTRDRVAIQTYDEVVMTMLEKQFLLAVVKYHDIYEVSLGGRSGQTTDNNNCRAKGKGGGRGGGTQVPMVQLSPADSADYVVANQQP